MEATVSDSKPSAPSLLMLRLVKDIIGAQAWQGAILCCTILIQLAVARFIGSSALGVTAIIISSSSLCVLLIELNLQSAIVRAISLASAEDRTRLRGNILEGRLLMAVVLSPLVGSIAAWSAGHHQLLIFAGVVGAVLAQELNPSWWLQGTGQAGRSFFLAGVAALISALVAIPTVFWFRQPASESLIVSLGGILVYSWFWRHEYGVPAVFRQWRARVSVYLAFAWSNRSFLIGGVAVYLYLYPTQLMLAYLRGTEEAGLYRVAMMPGTAYYVLTVAAFNAYYPQVVRAYAESLSLFEQTLRRVALLVFIIGVLAWLVALFTQDLFEFAVGQNFEISILLAPALVISKVIGGLVLVMRAGLLAKGQSSFVYVTYACVGILGLCLNFVFIPTYGLLGAAIVEISVESFHGMILLFALRDPGFLARLFRFKSPYNA